MLTLTRLARPPWTSASRSDLVGVLQADIFADHADRHFALGMVDAVHDVLPAAEVGIGRVVDVEHAQHFVVEPLGMILQRHVVDRARVERLDHRRLRHVAEQSDLGAVALGNLALGAAQQDVGLDAVAGQLAHAVLGRLGLQLARGGEVRHQRRVDEHRLAAAEVVLQLADRLDERQALDVADGAADLADDEVEALDVGQREFLDRVGDVGNDLDGRAEIVAAPLAGDDAR